MVDIKESMAEDIAIDIIKKLLREWAKEGDYDAIVTFMNPGLIKHKEAQNER